MTCPYNGQMQPWGKASANRNPLCVVCAERLTWTGEGWRHSSDPEAFEPCPVVVGKQGGVGPGLFIICGERHTVAEHRDPSESVALLDLLLPAHSDENARGGSGEEDQP